MRKFVYLCVLIFMGLNVMAQIDLNDRNWECVLDDEFSSNQRTWNPSSFDENVTSGTPVWRCGDAEYWPCQVGYSACHSVYQPSHAVFSNGNMLLVIENQNTWPLGMICNVDYILPYSATCEGCYHNSLFYKSGTIQSFDKYGYGYYEIRYRMSLKRGVHGGFWLFGNGPDKYEEIDIMEYSEFNYDGDSLRGYSLSLWHNPYSTQYTDPSGGNNHANTYINAHYHIPTTEPNLNHYHTYGCEWMPDYIKWYCDGKIIAEYYDSEHISHYKKRIKVTCELESQSIYPSPWSGKDTITIDYIRHYRLKTDCDNDVSIRSLSDWNSYEPSVKRSITIGAQNSFTAPQGARVDFRAVESITIDKPFVLPSNTEMTMIIQECPENLTPPN